MTVIAFAKARQQGGDWRVSELNQIAGSFVPELETGQASGWAVATTEIGDPQFYLLGPAPDDDCILCVSRLGSIYVLEDGSGHVLFEHNSLLVMAAQARAFLRARRVGLIARLALLWCSVRHAWQNEVEEILIEGEELLTVLAPELAAFA